ncbi:MAG: hypothetical protein QNK24_05550 [Desulfuromusa sp.]|nr:hypothetical protein [Desulfuromusa sp.]
MLKKMNKKLHAMLANLIDLARADTLYCDVYILRARYYLKQELSHDGYLGINRIKIREASLPNQIRNAMNRGDWHEVYELSGLYKSLQEELEGKKTLEEFARKIYDSQDIPIDPFSPGMHKIAGFSTNHLPDLRNKAIRGLKELSQSDSDWKEFYAKRQAVFTALIINTNGLDTSSQPSSAIVLEEEAAEALETGNMARLELLAEKLSQNSSKADSSTTPAEFLEKAHKAPDEYLFEFPQKVLKKAADLGLELYSVPSRSAEYAPFSRFSWHPTYSDLQSSHPSVMQVPDLPFPTGFPEALKSRIQLFAIHPFINSAGVRYLPNMIAEDVLVEGFPEPEAGSDLPSSGLLEALGLKQRSQLSRQQIEAVLLDKGGDLLRDELGLDPIDFKLVCIPPDLHLRIGLDRGWGQQRIWTHFDGYMIMADANRWALAGGDVRYGGIYDLLGLSCRYDSDRIISRFAVVQRCRMAIWQ